MFRMFLVALIVVTAMNSGCEKRSLTKKDIDNASPLRQKNILLAFSASEFKALREQAGGTTVWRVLGESNDSRDYYLVNGLRIVLIKQPGSSRREVANRIHNLYGAPVQYRDASGKVIVKGGLHDED